MANPRAASDQTDQPDRLSPLPDALLITILSFPPTRVAACTSLLSRRFRQLWQMCPTLELTCDHSHPPESSHYFVTLAYYALCRRRHPLLSLRVDFKHCNYVKYVYLLFSKARSLGVRDLIIKSWPPSIPNFSTLLRVIFSIATLESLALPKVSDFVYPFRVASSRLRSLSLELQAVDPGKFNRLVSELRSLEDLHLKNCFIWKMTDPNSCQHFEEIAPFLRKAVVDLDSLCEKDCGGVAELLNYVSHVEELILHIIESEFVKDPFPILLEPGKNAPNFPNLKHLEVTMCFRKHNFEAILSMLYHSPALQSLKLAHHEILSSITSYTESQYLLTRIMAPVSDISGGSSNSRRRKDWESKLPHNTDGDNRYVHFTDLQLKEQKKQFEELLKKKDTPN